MKEAMIGAYYASRPAASGRAKTARSGNCPPRRGYSVDTRTKRAAGKWAWSPAEEV